MVKKDFLKSYIIIFILTVIIAIAFIFTGQAEAASLYFSPSAGNFAIGDIFTVSLLVNTQGKAINNSDAVINFSPEFLEVVSVSKSRSVFSLWIEEPSFSNSAGTVSFNGGLPTPGFSGTTGNLIDVVFKAKKTGSAPLIFSSAAVRANDGYGTDILYSREQAQFNLGIIGSSAGESITPIATLGVPLAPEISSLTHPDPNKWYVLKDAKFAWILPKDITAVRFSADRISQAEPTVTYSPAVSSKDISDLEDGIWYFSVRLKNDFGWGAISHFRFKIDTMPPKPFSIKFPDGKETDNPRPLVFFNTTDSLSGIDYYKIKIGEGDFFGVAPEIVKSNPYTLPLQAPAKRIILVQAYDKAGNYSTASEEFVIKSIEPPVITEYPKNLLAGDILTIKGTSFYPNSTVIAYIEKEGEGASENEVITDAKGNWSFIYGKSMKEGNYMSWAKAKDQRGALSDSSSQIDIPVSLPPFMKFGKITIDYLNIMVNLIVLIIGVIAIIVYSWHRISLWRKRIQRETKEAEESLRAAFVSLRKDVKKQTALLDGKPGLSEKEKKICDSLKDALNIAEKFVGREIEDIGKEVK